mmetsp:Transcript_9172/g.24002  ORF Transcript_9172/g.24002 Transcript_9172/m.24002 type:complete len:500 (+) Transcript_9172:112-1611(+)
MSLRLLKKSVGDDQEASFASKSVVQPHNRGRGRGAGRGYYSSAPTCTSGPPADIAKQVDDFIKENDVDERTAAMLRQCAPDIQHNVLERGSLTGTRDPSQVCRARIRAAQREAGGGEDVGGEGSRGYDAGGGTTSASTPAPSSTPYVMAPVVTGFRGSSAQAAHIEATKRAAADQAKQKAEDWTTASEIAVQSGLGLKAVEERKQREEEERQAKRDAARAKRRNEVSRQVVDETKALAECEEQAWCDAESNDSVKYEAALIVRIAVRFGTAGVWVKIAEARARGAEIPLDPKRIYLLAHPDKCHLPEASDATAILNAQRPPEMTESRAGSGAGASAGNGSGPGSIEAVAARVAASREVQEAPPPSSGGPETEDEARRRRMAARAAAARSGGAVSSRAVAVAPSPPRERPAAVEAPAATATATPEPSKVWSSGVAAAAPAPPQASDGQVRKIDPEDRKPVTFYELREKYSGAYSEDEIKAYWNNDCQPMPNAPAKNSKRY